MEVLLSKVSSLFILAFSTTLVGLLPLKLRKPSANKLPAENHDRTDRFLTTILSFSGGVLLSTIFIHLMPDVDAEFDKVLTAARNGLLELGQPAPTQPVPTILNVNLPWGQLAICLGFFFIYALEEIVEYFVCRACEKQHHHHKDSSLGVLEAQQVNESTKSSSTSEGTNSSLSVKYKSVENPTVNGCLSLVHGTHGSHREPHQLRDCDQPRRSESAIGFDEVDIDEKTPLLTSSHNHEAQLSSSHDNLHEIYVPKDEGDAHGHSHHEQADSSQLQNIRNTMRGVMLIVALSFHSVFEGMAIGLQFTVSGVWTSFAAVALHKLVMAFCAAAELVTLGTKRTIFLLSMIAFALICPIGIAIGTAITESTNDAQSAEKPSLLIASLQGLACGTLLYVTFFEVLTRTKGRESSTLLNFVAVLSGFALITALNLLE